MENSRKSNDVYSIATNKIIEHLENGTIPWRKPWISSGLPQNLITRKSYRGINLWLLNACDYPQNYFLTFKQVKALKGTVKKGETAHPVLFWKWVKKDPKNPIPIEQLLPQDIKALLRYYLVFNVDQCTGIPSDYVPIVIARENHPLQKAEEILDGMKTIPQIVHISERAYYQPDKDIVNMPKMDAFVNSEAYYATLFHEVVHSTGHATRLDRTEGMASRFGSDSYSMEEMIAEFGASYLSSYAGIVIDDYTNNASYIEGWLKVLKSDKRFIVSASAQAQRAVEYILSE